jgi:hypothetical protein
MGSGARTPVQSAGLRKAEIGEGPQARLCTLCQLGSFGAANSAPLKMKPYWTSE